MPELRQDPLVGRWVVIAPERARRPSDFRPEVPAIAGGPCPFCPGNESLTTPELLSVGRPPGAPRDGPGWSLRVVPNKFPALRVEGDLARESEGIFDRVAGVGAHEVIIESPSHEHGLGDLPLRAVEDVLWAWGERTRDLSRDRRLRSVQIFQNHGPRGGATLAHPHSQLVALPLVPPALAAELATARAHFERKERCLTCDVLRAERRAGARVVLEGEGAVAFTPFASRVPFETWIVPTVHASHFEDEPRVRLAGVAEVLREMVRRLDLALERPARNLLLQSGPLREHGLPHHHWRLELLPSTTRMGGFEQGTGVFINPVPPEEAAAFLRRLG